MAVANTLAYYDTATATAKKVLLYRRLIKKTCKIGDISVIFKIAKTLTSKKSVTLSSIHL